MKNKIVIIFMAILLLGGGFGIGFYARSQTIKPKATFPNFFGRILTLFIKQGEAQDEDLLYHDTSLVDFIANGSTKTKVSVEGIVDEITHEPDGDYHIVIRPQYLPLPVLITEAIPEIKDLPIPKVGDYIRIWGITRFDIPHNWWELHPVVGWEKL